MRPQARLLMNYPLADSFPPSRDTSIIGEDNFSSRNILNQLLNRQFGDYLNNGIFWNFHACRISTPSILTPFSTLTRLFLPYRKNGMAGIL